MRIRCPDSLNTLQQGKVHLYVGNPNTPIVLLPDRLRKLMIEKRVQREFIQQGGISLAIWTDVVKPGYWLVQRGKAE